MRQLFIAFLMVFAVSAQAETLFRMPIGRYSCCIRSMSMAIRR